MSRALWKGHFIDSSLFLKKKKKSRYGIVKIWSRNSTICEKFLNKKVNIHNGRDFRFLFITKDHLGFKFGHFIFTRNFTRAQKLIKK